LTQLLLVYSLLGGDTHALHVFASPPPPPPPPPPPTPPIS